MAAREAFRAAFSFEKWFDEWREQLGTPSAVAVNEVWSLSLRRAVLEALSDAGAEQFLNPLVASHLRAFGSRIARACTRKSWFWVRSEWDKVDVSYGLAPSYFAGESGGWDKAWLRGKTGDLGQCEVKVCYTHHYAGKMEVLKGQLKERKDRDDKCPRPHLGRQQYHGLVWLFEHGDFRRIEVVAKRLEQQAGDLGLEVVRPFLCPKRADNLGRLWPSCKGDYTCGLSLALVELNQK